MNDYKFDTFYYSGDNSNEHYLSELENLSDDDYRNLYKGKMYCPCCKNPLLSLVKKEEKIYLRTYPNQTHIYVEGEMCPYSCDVASKKIVENYIQELKEKKKIKSLLEATMRKVFQQKPPDDEKPKVTEKLSKNPLLIEKTQSDKTIKNNIIPHYNFRSWGKNIPQDQLLILYGKVYIELKEIHTVNKEGNQITQTYIHFKNIDSGKLITSCIKPQMLKITNGNHYAVVLGTCHPKEVKGFTFYNLWINSPVAESILLKPLSL